MKGTILLVIIFLFTSCASKEDKVKEIIDESYFGMHRIKKMKEIEKLKEDIYSLPIHYTIVQKYVDVNEGNEYEVTRYIYKTDKGANRIFYLIDYTNGKVIEKSSDSNAFFKPILVETLGRNIEHMEGDNLMELMRY